MVELAQHWLPVVKIIAGVLVLTESAKYKNDSFKRWCLIGISAAIIL